MVVSATAARCYALSDHCSHLGGPLHEGELSDGHDVTCPLHESVFDLRDGSLVHGPARVPAAGVG